MPRVSIIMPTYNAAACIRQCADSVLNQTMKDIEVIFVDAGSTDGTSEILEEYTRRDPRTRLLASGKKNFGYQINIGFDTASGEYLGIVKTDNTADPDMYETLYETAKIYDADVVKSGILYDSEAEEKSVPAPIASEAMSSWTFCPADDFRAPLEQAEFFNSQPTICSAIYKRSFLRENEIPLSETPGVSVQEESFSFTVWACAKRVRLVPDCFLHIPQTGENAPIVSIGEAFSVCDEYEAMESFLESRPLLKAKLDPVLARIKFDSYDWMFDCLSGESQPEFLRKFRDEMTRMNSEGRFNREFFERWRFSHLMMLIADPDEFLIMKNCRKVGVPYTPKASETNSSNVQSTGITPPTTVSKKYSGKSGKIRSLFDTFKWSLHKNGFFGTVGYFLSLVRGRFLK